MEELERTSPGCFDAMRDTVVSAILAPPASSIQLIRTWLLEIFCRGIIDIPLSKLKKFEPLPSALDKRQLLLIRGRVGDKNFFRKKKTAAHSYSTIELPYLVWGASCLPKDEYENWLDTVKGALKKRPLGDLYLKWSAKHRTALIDKLMHPTVDMPE